MPVVLLVASLVLILVVLIDAFESMLLPRRVSRHFRFARFFYLYSWAPWSALARRMKPGKRRETFLSWFGPLAILVLFGVWAAGLIVGFATLHWSLASPLNAPAVDRAPPFDYLYMSGVTFFTLGFGDITPVGMLGRTLAVAEAGLGFGFLAVVISYLPVLFQAFAGREVTISLLDARASSPPSAGQLLLRLAPTRHPATLDRFLEEWERWAAELLASHLSFPNLSFYRSQHDNQSWLGALTAMLDTCALVITGIKGAEPYQAQLTFAMARHAAVDLAQVFQTPPVAPDPDRLPADRRLRLREQLRAAGLELREGAAADQKLDELRGMYEPFVNALARHFLLNLPPVLAEGSIVDNWQTSAWMRRTSGIGTLAAGDPRDDHAD